METYIITGGSKGLGAAIIRQLLEQGAAVHCISRSENETLRQEALRMEGQLTFHAYDLAQTEGIDSLMERILAKPDGVASVTLINNAGMLEPMTSIGRAAPDDLQRSLQVNLVAPAVLTNSFIRLTQAWPMMKRVVGISSGAGRKPYPGWGAYCTAKAGLDMLTRCVGVEQLKQPHPVLICSVAPGVVDTDMQREIRAASEEDFPQVERFVQLKEQGELRSPEDTAKQLLHLLQANAFEQGEIADLRTKEPAS
ncbi:Benzil reductase ((S)-benzoin forming) [Paenibacillus allorhizoplanae]|uniref:Benzil reductase ((S)-benzoin forming) n=1 Tax=Paenibacillus allorhizoplanae TaxID=2905648 RepID=A0ABN8H6A2_9BACL|nr:(S)-benzoin forming benzil reductase [Paenibacillus allorhizoplanae]CAH1232093.1 Benzil reductase ((S)-benzoin forming) [Paenibacillus allorhizoplanae]